MQDFEKNWGLFVKLDFNQDGIVTQQEIGRYVNTQAGTAGLYTEINNWLKARDIPIGRPPEFAVPEKPEWTETEKQYNNDRLNRGLTTASYMAAPFAGAKFVTAIPKAAPHVGNAIGGMLSASVKKSVAETAIDAGEQALVKRNVRDIDFANAAISGMPLPDSFKDVLKTEIDISMQRVSIFDDPTDERAAEWSARRVLGLSG